MDQINLEMEGEKQSEPNELKLPHQEYTWYLMKQRMEKMNN